MNVLLYLFFLILLLIFSAFFSASEAALMTINRIKLLHLCQKGNKRAKKVRHLTGEYQAMLSTILVGNNFMNVGASVLATLLGIHIVGEDGLIYLSIAMTIILLVFCEITPKIYASAHSEQIAMSIALPIQLFIYILRPVVWCVNKISNLVLLLFGQQGFIHKSPILTSDEIKVLIALGEQEGVIATNEKRMLQSILDLTHTTVKEVMVPRTEMVALKVDSSKEDIFDSIARARFSRFPVYKESIDNIIGTIHAKDLFLQQTQGLSLASIMKNPFFVPESMRIHHLLGEFKKGHIHMAIVVDEYGGVEGMVTMEDLLEEIVGDIRDEFDVSSGTTFQNLPDGSILVKGNVTLRDIKRYLNVDLGEEEITLSGLILEELGHLPQPGEILKYKEYTITVVSMRKQKISQIKISMGN